MADQWIVAGAVISVGLWLAHRHLSGLFRSEFKPPRTQPVDPKILRSFETAPSLFVNASERHFYQSLARVLPAHYSLHSKTRLEDIIRVKSNISAQERWSLRGRVKSRHVDFLIIDRAGCPRMAIELDGASHNGSGYQNIQSHNADQLKDGLFAACGLPLYRVRADADFNQVAQTLIAELKSP